MATLSTVPTAVDLKGYVGDTLTVRITGDFAVIGDREWLAQVKATRDAVTADATFEVTPPATDGDPAYLTLPADVTTGLGVFSGFWDCQISGAGGADPVVTLAQGKFSLTLDVSRD